MEQRIYLDKKNRLVIETNNGKQDINGTTTKVEGDFTVSAEDVVKLFAFVNKKDVVFPCAKEVHPGFTYWYDYKTVIITHDKSVEKAFADVEQALKEKSDKIEEYCDEVSRLRKAIKDFNNSRKWYERRINID